MNNPITTLTQDGVADAIQGTIEEAMAHICDSIQVALDVMLASAAAHVPVG